MVLSKPTPPVDLQKLAEGIREHFEKVGVAKSWGLSTSGRGLVTADQGSRLLQVVAAVCDHFNDNDVDFLQQVWLCYERLFFEGFSSDFMPLYQVRD